MNKIEYNSEDPIFKYPDEGLIHPVGWGCRIHRLHLCRGVRPLPWVSWNDTKQSDEVPVMLEIWGMWSTLWGWRFFRRSVAKGKAVLPQDICLHILVILFYPTLTGRRNALPKESPKEIYKKKR